MERIKGEWRESSENRQNGENRWKMEKMERIEVEWRKYNENEENGENRRRMERI